MNDVQILEKIIKERVSQLFKQKENLDLRIESLDHDVNMMQCSIIDGEILAYNDVLKMIENSRRGNKWRKLI